MLTRRPYIVLLLMIILSLVFFSDQKPVHAQTRPITIPKMAPVLFNEPDMLAETVLPTSLCNENGVDIGAYVATDPPTVAALKGFESLIGRHVCSVMWYQGWSASSRPPFPTSALNKIKYHDGYDTHVVLHLDWEPWAKLSDIANGTYDSYLNSYAAEVKKWDGTVRLSFGHEMIQDDIPCWGQSGCADWYPWQDQPVEYVAAFQHVHDVFSTAGASNVEFVWCANNYPFDLNIIQKYYPGPDYVDWLCMDGYNPTNKDNKPGWPDWLWFDDIFYNIYHTFVDNPVIFGDKPVMIGEFASCEAGPYEQTGQTKPEWITNAFQRIKSSDYALVKAFYWFNIKKECDWRVNSSPPSLYALKTALQDDYFGSHRAIPINLLSPSDGEHVLTLRSTFDWTDSPDAGVTGYTIQISKNDTFTQVVHTGNPVESTYIPTVDLPRKATLYWRVKIRSAYGLSIPTETFSFTTPDPPGRPVLLLPAANALSTDYIPLFKWSVVTLPPGVEFQHYNLLVDDNPDFSSPVIDVYIPDRLNPKYQTVDPLIHNTKFYWKVKAVNTTNEWIESPPVPLLPRPLRTQVDPPVLTEPCSSTVLELRPTFRWNRPSGSGKITGYTIQISKNNTFTQIVHTGTSTKESYTPTVDLQRKTTFYWHVQTKGDNGPSEWSDDCSFISANPPTTPALVLPANNALVPNDLPLFKWSVVTIPPPTVFQYYHLLVDDNPDFSSPVIDERIPDRLNPQYQTTIPLAHNTKFYWKVNAVNTDNEESNWSAVRYFRTKIDPPTVVTPADGATGISKMPLLDWSDVPGNTGYVLQVWKAGTTPVLVKSVTLATNVSQYQFLTNLLPNTAYFWKVQTKGTNGPSLWSENFDFTTGP